MTTIGFIGSGHIGGTVAGLAIAAGHDVVLSNSRGQDTLVDLVTELGPHASAASTEDAAKQGEIVVVSIPLRAYQDVPVEPLAGKIVIDTNNYYWQRDGHFAEIDDESTTSAELLQRHLPTSRVVKAFNHIQYLQLAADGQPVGSDNRRALVIVGDDAGAKNVVTDLLDSFGYDVVDAGPLAEGWRFEPDHPAYGPRFTADEMREALAGARRRVRTD
jgi:predicted dinucleotide-binding enzyme